MTSHEEDITALSDKLELENPGKTIVLNAKTREVIVVSGNPIEISRTLKTLRDDVVTLFIGGPFTENVACHHFCSSPTA